MMGGKILIRENGNAIFLTQQGDAIVSTSNCQKPEVMVEIDGKEVCLSRLKEAFERWRSNEIYETGKDPL